MSRYIATILVLIQINICYGQKIIYTSIQTLNISGKYHSNIIAKKLSINDSTFYLLNPNFDKIILTKGNYNLRLPEEKMDLFIELKYLILNESSSLDHVSENIQNNNIETILYKDTTTLDQDRMIPSLSKSISPYYEKDQTSKYKPEDPEKVRLEKIIQKNRVGVGNSSFNLTYKYLENLLDRNTTLKQFENLLGKWSSIGSQNWVSIDDWLFDSRGNKKIVNRIYIRYQTVIKI